jgi:hypothetical protein
VVVNTDKARLEETVITAPFDHDASGLQQLLRDKWHRLLPPQDAPDLPENDLVTRSSEGRALLWQRIEACVSMASQRRSEPEPIKG